MSSIQVQPTDVRLLSAILSHERTNLMPSSRLAVSATVGDAELGAGVVQQNVADEARDAGSS